MKFLIMQIFLPPPPTVNEIVTKMAADFNEDTSGSAGD